MKNFRDLMVWEKSHLLTLAVYKATVGFPKEEVYGLTSQMRRSSSSIPANIAEGCGRSGPAELLRFLHISMGSASELEYHLMLARDLGFLSPDRYKLLSNQAIEVKRMLGAYIQSTIDDLEKQKREAGNAKAAIRTLKEQPSLLSEI